MEAEPRGRGAEGPRGPDRRAEGPRADRGGDRGAEGPRGGPIL